MRARLLTLPLALALLGTLSAATLAQTDIIAPQLRITTDPEMADIRFDGALQGQSPLTLSDLAPGPHLLSVTKSGYHDVRQSIALTGAQRIALNLTLEPVSGLILLHSTPPGSDVEIDGAHRGSTPLLLTDLPVGRYRVHFSQTGYLPKDIDLAVEDRTPIRIPVELTSDSATLTLDSTPPGATVTLNGIAKGRTPCRLDRVAAGESELQISLEGYRTFARTIRLAAGQGESVTAALDALPATLNVVSIPTGARIYVNDEFRGEAPLTLAKLDPGLYRLRAEKKGYDVLTRSASLARAQSKTTELRLVSNAGALEVITHPVGVRVLVDGKERGVTLAMQAEGSLISAPLKIELVDIGEHRVQLVREGYFEKTLSVTVKRQEATPIQESLKRRFIPDTEIKTAQGVYKGVFIDEGIQGKIRIEVRPGVIKSIEAQDIVSRRAIP
ncbi:MAG: PEGA domain-containing protein [Verrucomicrobia bacterium]|jgi:hypothetical protein|nr:PEGA domain-containing protein [Verrucomicrobiota bacterium]MBT7068706.1 PEGA domain-containing protein [Verrucomicrobiota bacterium]MBT7701855.1 PEGA domain-containing protein [Verrucomicrobiota bacterium]